MSYTRSPAKFAIPIRTSSRRGRPEASSAPNGPRHDASPDKSIAELQNEYKSVCKDLKEAYKRVRPSESFDVVYWQHKINALQIKRRSNRLRTKLSMKHFKESNRNEDWETSLEYQKEIAKTKATEVHLRLAQKHTEFLQQEEDGSNSQTRSEEIAFVKLYITSLRGLGLSKNTAERERCSDQQSRFRQQLIQSYSAENPDEAGGHDELWCHILNKWFYKDSVKAAHIIPYKGGPELMDALFGREPGTESELFSPLNGLLMSGPAEAKFDSHSLVIVPNLEDTATAAQIHEWHESSERGYKIRVVNPKSQEMQKRIGGEESKRWIDLDHQVIEFRSSFRPRSRYLYFHYLTAMLKTAWTFGDLSDALEHELGKRYWATPGPYLRGRYLKAFVTEVGHVFEPVVKGCAIEEAKPEEVGKPSDLVGLGVAAKSIVTDHGTIGDEEEDEDESDVEDFEGCDELEFQGFGP